MFEFGENEIELAKTEDASIEASSVFGSIAPSTKFDNNQMYQGVKHTELDNTSYLSDNSSVS